MASRKRARAAPSFGYERPACSQLPSTLRRPFLATPSSTPPAPSQLVGDAVVAAARVSLTPRSRAGNCRGRRIVLLLHCSRVEPELPVGKGASRAPNYTEATMKRITTSLSHRHFCHPRRSLRAAAFRRLLLPRIPTTRTRSPPTRSRRMAFPKGRSPSLRLRPLHDFSRHDAGLLGVRSRPVQARRRTRAVPVCQSGRHSVERAHRLRQPDR